MNILNIGDRKINVSFEFPSIPYRNFDWVATFDDYDGAPDAGFHPVGRGSTRKEAVQDLLKQGECE